MKKSFYLLLAGMLFLSVFFACKKSDNNPQPDPVPDISKPDSTVSAGLQGRVTDKNGAPLKDVQISSGKNTTTTDINGVFSFSSIPLSKMYGYVKAQKAGFFTGSRTIMTSTQGINYVEIQLIPRILSGNFDAASGTTVSLSSGSSLVFPADAIMNAATHASYTGTVNVYATWLDPTDANLHKNMPGDLRGIDKDNKNVGLETFGMVNVELEGQSGEKLQMAEGKEATINLPIPAALLAAAPATIPLWYFNDTTGKWIEQGTATKKDNLYCGQTTHFTYWNCDVPRDLVYFSAEIKDAQSNALANTLLMITETGTGDTRSGYSDASGHISGWILKNAMMTFNLYDRCANPLASIPEGPFITDQDLGTLTANTSATQSVTFSGNVTDCSAKPVSSGFVAITIDGLQYAAVVTAGHFSTTILRCSATATTASIIAGDYATSKQSEAKIFDVSGANVNTGDIATCGVSFDQYVNFSFSGSNYTITYPPDSLSIYPASTYTLINGFGSTWGNPNYRSINFYSQSTSVGTSPLAYLTIYIGQEWYSNKQADPLSVTFTSYDPGQTGYVEGTFNGNIYKDSAGVALPLTGNFRVKE